MLNDEELRYLRQLVAARDGQLVAHCAAMHVTTDEINAYRAERSELTNIEAALTSMLRESIQRRMQLSEHPKKAESTCPST